MTDREMLLLAYDAMKAVAVKGSNYSGDLSPVVELIEEHLWPAKVVNVEHESTNEADH